MEFKDLYGKNLEAAKAGCLSFLQGECFALAIAVHEGTGLPIYGVSYKGEILHAGVRTTEGVFFDARGYVKEEEIAGWPFHEIGPGYTVIPVTKERLYEIREGNIFPNVILLASQHAQASYPELSWSDECISRKVRQFGLELEELCRKHGFYISPFVEASPPVISSSEDDVWEYVLSPGLTGSQFFLRREIIS